MKLDKKITFNQVLFILVLILVAEFFALKDLPFFWDAISKSVRADWIYNTDLTQFIVPTEINSGHPPLWISLLALFWSIFQKSLWSSRLLLLVVNIGVVWQIILLCKNNFVTTVSIFTALLVCLEPTFIAQTTSLNNDMLLLFFTLLSLNSLIKSKSLVFTLALTGLLFTNLRGIYIFLAILIIHAIYVKYKFIKNRKLLYLGYLVALLCFSTFCYFQYEKLGWFVISKNEVYNTHRQSVGIKQLFINCIIYTKCFLDYGRFIILLFLLPLLFKYFKSKNNKNLQINRLLIAYLVFAVVFFIGMVPFSNPFGNRYFMICYILSIILLINLLHHYKVAKKPIIYISVMVMFISGHFWIYPATISQSWDSSLAYLNSYNVEKKMEGYIDLVGIKHSDIGTRVSFNYRNYSEFLKLEENNYYADFNINTNKFILLSNIENGTKDEELNFVIANWQHLKSYSQLGVFMSLYKKN